MKKIPTLFERVFDNHHKVGINNKVHPGMEWVLGGEGTATEKIAVHPAKREYHVSRFCLFQGTLWLTL